MKRQLVGFLVIAIMLPSWARAQGSGAAAAEIRRQHILAGENYDLADFAGARDRLLAALDKAKESDLEQNILTAKTHVMLGAIYIMGAGDQAKAIEHFKLALEIAPGIEVEPPFDAEQVKAALARADAELHPIITCKTLRGIDHQQVVQAPAGQPVAIAFRAGPELRHGTAHLSFRPQGTPDFTEVDMSLQGECDYIGNIPADAVRGELIHYFVSMKKKDGRYIAMRGNPKSPYSIIVLETANESSPGPETTKNEVPDELVLQGRRSPRGAGCAGCAAGASSNGAPAPAYFLLGCALLLARRFRCERRQHATEKPSNMAAMISPIPSNARIPMGDKAGADGSSM